MARDSSSSNLSGHELRLAQLTASRSLVRKDRREGRQDVLINTIVAILAERQSLSETQLLTFLRKTWQTTTLSDELFSDALDDARRAGLITTRPDKHGATKYIVSGDAKSHNDQDRQYAATLVSSLKSSIADRLKGYPDESRLANRLDRIVNEVLTAIAHACQESYDIPIPGSAQTVHPIRLSEQEVRRYARQLDPESIRQPVEDLAFDALDPADSFGNELVHLVVVGGLLHGLSSQRGVSVSPSLQHMHLLLDTSALIGIVQDEHHSEYRTLTELISLSKRCDAKLVVAEHTIDEWERVWIAADEQFDQAELNISKGDTLSVLTRYAQNPFIGAYVDYLDKDGQGSWIGWANARRDLRTQVENLGLQVVAYEDSSNEETRYRERIHSDLVALSEDSNVPGRRSRGAADADAKSAALISRWRRKNGDDTAIFIAKDYLTNLAFTSSASGSNPLVVNPTLWLQYVTCLLVDDADERIEIANLIADVGVRNMILGMASTYSLEEILEISDVLMAEGIELNVREARDLADLRLYQSLDEMHQEALQDVNVRVQTILSRRTTRSIQRVSNREASLQEKLDSFQEVADEKSHLADKYKSAAEQANIKSAEDRVAAAEALADKRQAEDRNVLLKRTLYSGAGSTLVLILFIVLAAWGFIGGLGILFGVLVWVGGVVAAYSWVQNRAATFRGLLGGVTAQIVLEIVVSAVT